MNRLRKKERKKERKKIIPLYKTSYRISLYLFKVCGHYTLGLHVLGGLHETPTRDLMIDVEFPNVGCPDE